METESQYITLAEAARRAGYLAPNNLRTILLGPRAYVTTQEWLDAYLATLRPGNYKRGLAKSSEGHLSDGAGVGRE